MSAYAGKVVPAEALSGCLLALEIAYSKNPLHETRFAIGHAMDALELSYTPLTTCLHCGEPVDAQPDGAR